MSTVSKSIGYRILWSGFAAALCAFSIYRAASGEGWSHLITAAAWGLFGVSWFMQPTVPASTVSAAVAQTNQAVVGKSNLRLAITLAALVLLVVGLLVRWLGGA